MATLIDFAVKELLQIRRDRRMAFALLVAPILQLVLFGYALNADVKHIGVMVCDMSHSAESRELVRRLTSSEYFDVLGAIPDSGQARDVLVAGRADVVLVIPPDYARLVASGDTAPLQALVDGSNPNTATIAAGYLGAVVQTRSVELLTSRVARAGARRLTSAGLDVRMRVWYNPTLETKYAMVPGVICTVVGMMTMMLAASAIVKEREDGTIEQLIVTPVRPWELVAGKSFPILLIGYAEVVSVLGAGVLIFHVPVRGSVLLMLLLACPFLLSSLAMGLVVSASARTQSQATMTMAFLALPNMLLSGFMFPISSMPPMLQAATRIIPMRYFLVIVRDIVLKGSGLDLLRDQVGPLVLLAVVFMAIATLQFRKRLD